LNASTPLSQSGELASSTQESLTPETSASIFPPSALSQQTAGIPVRVDSTLLSAKIAKAVDIALALNETAVVQCVEETPYAYQGHYESGYNRTLVTVDASGLMRYTRQAVA